jgi:hypothetical protein
MKKLTVFYTAIIYIPRNIAIQGGENLYNEKLIIMKNKIEEDTKLWEDFPCSWNNIAKLVI